MSEASDTFTIINDLGLHARAAAKLVKLAGSFEAKVELSRDGSRTDAKSIMGVLLLCGVKGSEITVHAKGGDAGEAIKAIGELIKSRFGEPS